MGKARIRYVSAARGRAGPSPSGAVAAAGGSGFAGTEEAAADSRRMRGGKRPPGNRSPPAPYPPPPEPRPCPYPPEPPRPAKGGLVGDMPAPVLPSKIPAGPPAAQAMKVLRLPS